DVYLAASPRLLPIERGALAPPMTSRATDRVFGLDLLRAAAIMMVICAHGFVVLYPHFGDALGVFGHGGFYGVELFFVLSGFLIGQILIRRGLALGRAANVAVFYVRRWFRTLPLRHDQKNRQVDKIKSVGPER